MASIRREQLPGKVYPSAPIAPVHPDLAVEILGPANTRRERERKVFDHFKAGTTVLWRIDPDGGSAEVHASDGGVERVEGSGEITGGTVLPGFRLPLRELFARAREAPEGKGVGGGGAKPGWSATGITRKGIPSLRQDHLPVAAVQRFTSGFRVLPPDGRPFAQARGRRNTPARRSP